MGKRDSKRREMAKLVARWRASGKSAASFAREAGIPESRLWYWARRSGASEVAAFVPVRVIPEESAATTSASFELFLGDGRRLVIPASLAGRPLRQLLSALRAC
ncbi:MAG: hypothetical protein LC136_15250 [Burkholderiales bacterium]|nr:hypothetical protein [Burkholderiales bacterium]